MSAHPPKYQITWPWGSFRDKREESRFLAELWPEHAPRLRLLCLLTSILVLSGCLADYFYLGIGFAWYLTSALRLVTSGLGLSCFLIARKARNSARQCLNYHLVMFVYGCMVGIVEAVELPFIFDPTVEFSPPIAVLIFAFFYLFLPVQAKHIIIAANFNSIIYVLALAFFTPSSPGNTIIMFLFFCASNLLGIHFLHGYNLIQRKAFLALKQQKRLNRLLETEMKAKDEANRKLEALAATDHLTGLANRRKFFEVLEAEVRRSRRYGHGLSLMMLDIDHFKKINDRFGHQAGDMALKELARICSAQLRGSDLMARMGGEEFCVILPETGPDEAMGIAQRMRGKMESTPIETESGPMRMTISIGIAGSDQPGYDGEELIRQADQALYRAKEMGRNQVMAA